MMTETPQIEKAPSIMPGAELPLEQTPDARATYADITPEEAERRRQEKAKQVQLVVPAKVDSVDDALASLRKTVRVKRVPDAAAEKAAHDAEVRRLLLASNAPERHRERTQFDDRWANKLEKWKTRLGTGFLLALIGEWDGGKTQFAVELIRANAARLVGSQFCTATDFFMDIKATYKPHGLRSERDVIDDYSKASLLVVDEMAKRSENAWENNLLFHLLNKRYNAKLDTVLIANQTQEQFDSIESAGPAIVRRLNETGALINCDDWVAANKGGS